MNIRRELEKYIYSYDIIDANKYKRSDIVLYNKVKLENEYSYAFIVKDNIRAIVEIRIKDKNISKLFCTCHQFMRTNSCPHIGAVFLNCEDVFMSNTNDLVRSKELLNMFLKKDEKKVKRKINVMYSFLYIDSSYYNDRWIFKIKIGYDKLYTLGQKYKRFIDSFHYKRGEVSFGKNFTYDPNLCYFDEQDEEIFEFLFSNVDYFYDNFNFNDRDMTKLLSLLKNRKIYIEDVGETSIKDEFPFKSSLSKKDGNYTLNIDIKNEVIPFVENYEYIYYNNNIYHLTKERDFIKALAEREMNTLVFKEEDLDIFSKSILPFVRNNIELSEELKELNLGKNIETKMYFDIDREDIIANLVFLYDNVSIDYFSINKDVLRDQEYENKALEDLLNLGFVVNKNKIILEGLQNVVEFLEYKLDSLTEKYQVFTSQNLKNTNINKKVNITSTFSIGRDNIMKYNFEFSGVEDDEVSKILSSLKRKKKYYKLKSGDIISLEDEGLNELNNLIDNMDLSESGSGVIPKYKAIYLDSLKDDKYLNIKTNNLFNEFIDKFKKYKDVDLEFSKEEKEILRDYQMIGIKWLYTIVKCDLGGILADEMGLGKSIQTIYLFKKLLLEDKNYKFLIVCPTSLIYNWENEFKKFGENIKVQVLAGLKKKREEIYKNSDASVFITSYGLLRIDEEMYEKTIFKVCIIDEAQNIKNHEAKVTKAVKKVNSVTKIALTGTPIENSIQELWSIFDFIMPGFLSNITKFSEKYKVTNFDEEDEKKLDSLNKIIMPFILRRKKSDVLKDLPPKIENNIYIDLGEEQKKLYALEIKKVNEEIKKLEESGEFNKSKIYILSLITRLRQLCIDPKLVYEDYKGESVKIDNLVSVVKGIISNGHKMLIFTSFKSALDIVKKEFDKEKISYYTIDGSVKSRERQDLVDKFNSDNTNVFLITIKAGGTGLNLTSAEYVIHLDLWWNPQVENQATDRAHRIGQTKTVEVVKLIAKGTIEERILELQNKKKSLSDKLIEKNRDESMLYNLTINDIKELLKSENE